MESSAAPRPHLALLTYPLAPEIQLELIRLLRTEWTRTDYDWLEAMNGNHSRDLAFTSVLARIRSEPVATATIHFSRVNPEVAVLGNVLTHAAYRGQRLAGLVIDAALAHAQDAGCEVCLLGTSRKPVNVYHQHGFAWLNGSVMRRGFGERDLEPAYFVAGQSVQVRAAHWGDLPGLTLLAAQPLATACLDYPRGLCSGRYVPAVRCLSNFPLLWNETVSQGGALFVAAEPERGRVFGFGTVTRTPGPARSLTATIDLVTHEHYTPQLPTLLARLLDDCRAKSLRYVEAYVAVGDDSKLSCLISAGFHEVARVPDALKFDRETRAAVLLGAKL